MSIITPDFNREPLACGPRLGEIFQLGYIVEDIETAIHEFNNFLGVGPWFWTRNFETGPQRYKGQPTDLDVTIAVSWSGNMQFELIQQKNDAPSVFLDHVEKKGYGFHHYAVMVEDIAAHAEKLAQNDIEIPFESVTGPAVGNAKLFYADTRRYLGAMLEVFEYSKTLDEMFGSIYSMTKNWDRKQLIHEM